MLLCLVVVLLASALAEKDYIIGGDDVTVAGKWPWQVGYLIVCLSQLFLNLFWNFTSRF